MTGWSIVLVSLALVWLVGALVLRVAIPGLHRYSLLGGGYLLGVLLVGNLLWLGGRLPIAPLVLWLPLALGLAAVLLGWRWRQLPPAATATVAASPRERQVMGVAAVLLIATGILVFIQALVLPTLTWDAWNAWLGKAKAWYFAGAFLPVLPLEAWLAQPAGELRSAVGAPYPEALPRVAAWLVAASGAWRDAPAHLLWPLLWVSLGLLCHGRLRERGVPASAALVATAGLLTLPFVAAHASLPGYADLWLATAVLFAGSAVMDQLERPSRARFTLAVLGIVLLPTIKLEGGIYAGLLLVAWLLWTLSPRWRWRLIVAGIALGGALFVSIGVHLPLPGVGWISLRWGEASVPFLGSIALSWRPVTATVLGSMFLLPNWSLLWFLVLPGLLLGWRRLRQPANGLLLAFLAGAMAFHVVLFFFTPASAWAEDLTSLNRLLLHVVPAWVFLLALLLSPSARVRGRAS
jgi:hypothetical protein